MKKLIFIMLICSLIKNINADCIAPDCKKECTNQTVKFDCVTLLDYKTVCRNGRCEYIPFMQKPLQYIFY